jgi:hypothetical protein
MTLETLLKPSRFTPALTIGDPLRMHLRLNGHMEDKERP